MHVDGATHSRKTLEFVSNLWDVVTPNSYSFDFDFSHSTLGMWTSVSFFPLISIGTAETVQPMNLAGSVLDAFDHLCIVPR